MTVQILRATGPKPVGEQNGGFSWTVPLNAAPTREWLKFFNTPDESGSVCMPSLVSIHHRDLVFPARGTPEAWMITRARTRAIDRIRAVRRRSETFVPPVDEGLAPAPPEPGGDAAERAEDRGVIRTALNQLPHAQREVIELAYYAGLTQTEISARLQQPLGTVKTRIRLGLERLREVVRRAT